MKNQNQNKKETKTEAKSTFEPHEFIHCIADLIRYFCTFY